MARKNLIKNFKMVDAESMASTITSGETNVEPVDQASISVEWTGNSPVGVLSVEASNSSDNDFTLGEDTWVTLNFGATIDITGNTGDHQLILNTMPFRYLRVVYTATSGTGSLTAIFHAKSIGA